MNLLDGVRVLDLSRILAGPWATQVLADFGAEVIKIERPGMGDDTRGWGPPFLKDADGNDTAESAYYLCANRGKRSVAIDFTRPEGQALIRALAARCQVLVENYKVGGLAKYGLDYASLRAVNPALVYCSITGYGQDGPYAQRAGYDAAIQAVGGLMSVTGEPDDAPGGGPQKVGVAATDLMTGMYAATAILAALRHAERSGQGQHIDLALLDTQVAWLANQASNWLVGGVVPDRQGTAHPNIVPYQVMPAADGHFMLAVGNDAQFARLCEVIGEPGLAADPRYASNAARVAHRAELVPLLQQRLRTRPAAQWLDALEKAVVPASPVNRIDQVFDDAQVQARGLRIDLPHAGGGTVPMVRNPLRFSATPLRYAQAAPVLGQHTAQVLDEVLAIDGSAFAVLQAAGVVQAAVPADSIR
ncbi:CaiB/BaiF CoA-transferase family protein [Stenotrophomonas sp. MYb238]|uniref:CaiB/BaiF CoA transferase family protein n=1 Tax=Stenotrophomonas sp. MYb238 TaxID=2040281 RepID=UPI001D1729D6|nr:CaiB/BaiF CoA-transferase family protein [Stenotrophomonas sp. MYb238]